MDGFDGAVGSAVDCSSDCWNGVCLLCGVVYVGCIGEILCYIDRGIVGTISSFANCEVV